MITMREIDDARHALGVERETFRSLRDHHLGTADAIERVQKAEARVESLIAQWVAQDCVEAEPAPGYWKMVATASRIDAKMYAKVADSEKEGQRLALEALKEAEKNLREVPCVDDRHEAIARLPDRIACFIRATWGEKNLLDWRERTTRVLEEAIELAQAEGLTEPFVKLLTSRVYSRDPGDALAEAGGVGVTLLAWFKGRDEDPWQIIIGEMDRIEKMDRAKLRAKQREKFVAGFGIDVEGASTSTAPSCSACETGDHVHACGGSESGCGCAFEGHTRS